MTNSLWVTLHILWKAVRGLIKSFPRTNRKWVTLDVLWKEDSSDIFLWPTGSEWHCTFFETWKPVSSHPFLWPTACEWHCTFCERQSHHIFSCDQQGVSDIPHFVKGSLITFFPWPTACEYLCNFFDLHSQHTSIHKCLICISSYPIYTYQKVRMWPYLFHIFFLLLSS